MKHGSLISISTEVLFTLLLALFFALIWFGYRTSIATSFPQLNGFGAGFLALFGVLVVYLCLRISGSEWAHWPNASGLRRLVTIGLFVPLFSFSAFGVIAGAMLLYEGPSICRDIAIELSQAYARLGAEGQALLRVPAIEQIDMRTAALRKRLALEIMNSEGGNLCGVGEKAGKTLDELEQMLPTFKRLRSPLKPTHDCRKTDELQRIVDQYDSLISEALTNLPERSRYRLAERQEFAVQLKSQVDEQTAVLARTIGNLSGVTTFALNLGLYRETLVVLEKSDQSYGSLYQRLANLVGAANIRAPSNVDISIAENIASFVQIFNSLYSRSDRSSTWIYLFGAAFIDLLASYMASRAILHRRSTATIVVLGGPGRTVGKTNVTYLWSPVAAH